jgi:YtoQ family protein
MTFSGITRKSLHRAIATPALQQRNIGAEATAIPLSSLSRSFSSTPAPVHSTGEERIWNVYLSGEIHSDWRQVIAKGVQAKNLPVSLSSPNTSHEDSDDCGAIILGMEEERHNWDKIGATMNGIRTKTLLTDADIVVVRFGEKYRQWNAAFDAGYAAALGKPIITLHPRSISHMLKEVNASANVVCEEAEQVVDTLAYVIRGELPQSPKDGENYVPIADRLGKGNPNP